MGLDNAKRRKSLGVHFWNVFSDSPTLTANIDTFILSFVQDDPLLHIGWGLELPALHPPQTCIAKGIGFGQKTSAYEGDSNKWLLFVLCNARLVLLQISNDVARSAWMQRTAERINQFKTRRVFKRFRVPFSSEVVENPLVFSIWHKLLRHAIENGASFKPSCQIDNSVRVLSFESGESATDSFVISVNQIIWWVAECRGFSLSEQISFKTLIAVA